MQKSFAIVEINPMWDRLICASFYWYVTLRSISFAMLSTHVSIYQCCSINTTGNSFPSVSYNNPCIWLINTHISHASCHKIQHVQCMGRRCHNPTQFRMQISIASVVFSLAQLVIKYDEHSYEQLFNGITDFAYLKFWYCVYCVNPLVIYMNNVQCLSEVCHMDQFT